MHNYSKANTGKLSDLDQYEFAPEGLLAPMVGKLFLGDLVNLTSMEVSLSKDIPNTSVGFFHSHKNNEELYIFLRGIGEMMIDEDRFTVSEGSVVKVAPDANVLGGIQAMKIFIMPSFRPQQTNLKQLDRMMQN